MMLRDQAQAMKARGEKGLVPFLTAGFPDEETFLDLLGAASDAGCPVIEIGIPFSDPIADGPIIQESSKVALENGMSLRRALALAKKASQTSSATLVVMSYFNPILRMGIEAFARAAADAGIGGVIVPDVPLEESTELRRELARCGAAFIDLIAPTSGTRRIQRITAAADGFVYLVSVAGVTGMRSSLSSDLGGFVSRVRAHTDLPLYVGFGVSTPEQAREASRHADGVIVGGFIRPNVVAPGGIGARCLFQNIYLSVEGDTGGWCRCTPVIDGEVLTDEAMEFAIPLGGGVRQVRRFEIPLTRAYDLAAVQQSRAGILGTWFTVELEITDAFGCGRLEFGGLELEYVVLEESLPGQTFTGESMVDPDRTPTQNWFLGGDGPDLYRGAQGTDESASRSLSQFTGQRTEKVFFVDYRHHAPFLCAVISPNAAKTVSL